MKVRLLFSATGLVVVQATLAQSSAPLIAPESEIRALLVERVDERKQSVGVVVGVIEPAGKRVVSYGRPAKNDDRPLDGVSVFQIGSVTKVFTSLLLSDMVQHDEVKLDDPVSMYLPKGVTMPVHGGSRITLRHLATHTSGLPRDPSNSSSPDPDNPYLGYPSVIPERGNKPTTAYGLVAIPETGKKAMPMVSYQHGTVYGQHEVPSFPEESMETRLMIAQFAGQGYVVVAADYFGLGLSTENEGFMVKGSHQQACLDMYYSARAVLEREHVQVTNFFVTGWSLGGFVTMAFLEKLESVGIPVRAASTASAPSDALVAFNGFLNFPRKIDAPWLTTIFALSSFSLEKYYGIPGLAQALINPDQYEISRKLYAREPFNLNEFPTDLHKLIRPEYFNPQYLAESAYGRLLKEAQTYRWIVKTPLRNYYGEIDEVITTGLGKLPMVYQQSIGNTQVEAFSAGPKANHRGTFAYAVAEQKKWFDSLLTR